MFNEDEISKEELILWMSHPCTQKLKEALSDERQTALEMWARGDFTHETSEGTAQANAEALGRVKAIGMVLDEIEDIKEQASNEDA